MRHNATHAGWPDNRTRVAGRRFDGDDGASGTVPGYRELQRFRDYLTTYSQQYAATIAVEHYKQVYGRTERSIQSEFAIIRVPGTEQWLGFRDVVRVDNVAMPNRGGRLAAILADPTVDALALASRIARKALSTTSDQADVLSTAPRSYSKCWIRATMHGFIFGRMEKNGSSAFTLGSSTSRKRRAQRSSRPRAATISQLMARSGSIR